MSLIDREKLMESLDMSIECTECQYFDDWICGKSQDWVKCCAAIANAPAVEAVPVKHGEWVVKHFDTEGNGVDIPFCTVCGKPNRFPQKTAFCPNCGARMDGGKDDEVDNL